MPIGNVVMLGLILSMFGSFMAVLAWGAWWSNQPSRPARRRSIAAAQPTRGGGDLQLAPVRVRRQAGKFDREDVHG